MKIKNYVILAVAATLASCSSEIPAEGTPPQASNPAGTNAFISLSMGIPSGLSTREITTADGTQTEYAVKEGKIFIFDNSDKCIEVADITLTPNTTAQKPADISVVYNTVEVHLQNIEKSTAGNNKYKALVILNPGTMAVPVVGTDYHTWSSTAQIFDMTDGEYFTMMNATGWKGAPTDITGEPTTLVEFDEDCIYYGTKTASQKTVDIYLQRGVAKISLTSDSGSNIVLNKETSVNGRNLGAKVTLTAWGLDIVNTKTYPVQNVSGLKTVLGNEWSALASPLDRFIGGTSYTRVGWAIDPNYDSYKTEFTTLTSDPTETQHDKALYCLENTFNLENMNKNQSTRLVFAGIYKPDGTEAKTFITFGNKIYTPSPEELNTNGIVAGEKALNEVLTNTTSAKEALGISDNTKVNVYVNGKVYYTVVLRHFNDTELGISSGFQMPENGYGTNVNNYLGRFGLVRNNWYEINLTSVDGPGSPVIPTPDSSTNDETEPYKIHASIQVLAWTMRKQDVPLR